MYRGRNILLIEKEQGLEQILTLLFKQAACTVEIAGSYGEACRIIKTAGAQKPFDVVVTDIHLSEDHGDLFFNNLATSDNPASVIVLTDYGTDELQGKLTSKGSTHYLVKPFESNALLEIIERILPQTTK